MNRPGERGAIYAAYVAPAMWVLAVAVVTEFLLLRTMSRTALHVPDVPVLQTAYSVGSDIGRFAYFVAVAALLATLVFFLAKARDGGHPALSALAIAVGAYVTALVATPGRLVPDAIPIAFSFAAVLVLAAAAVMRDWRIAPLAGLVVVAFGASSTWNLAQTVSATDGTWYGWTSELAIVAAALVVPYSLRVRVDRTAVSVGAIVAFVVLAYFTGNPSTSGILLLWNGGLGGVLPGTVYALAIGVLSGSLVALLRAGQAAPAVALILFVGAGATLQNTYQTGLLVAALLMLATLPLSAARRPSSYTSARQSAITGRNPAMGASAPEMRST